MDLHTGLKRRRGRPGKEVFSGECFMAEFGLAADLEVILRRMSLPRTAQCGSQQMFHCVHVFVCVCLCDVVQLYGFGTVKLCYFLHARSRVPVTLLNMAWTG